MIFHAASKYLFYILIAVFFSSTVAAQPVKVAVAANAQFVMKELQKDFKKKSGIDIQLIVGSSGKLRAQIENGAPFDIFLSADMENPQKLYKDGFGLSEPERYASGSLIVCSMSETLTENNWKQLLVSDKISKIAIANAQLAPYGKAAEQALTYYKLFPQAKRKLVFGESISQVNTYITTQTVQLGFTTEALVYELKDKKLNWFKIDPASYSEIIQGAIILKSSQKRSDLHAKRFYDYLFSADAKALFKRYGYRI
ncbi:molybdate ABC transporter substrate-binding protein [Pedobacter sp. HMF7647]|uniref:Molybdate ABC transporter substrate-binding protein n=1 Tax=Hufsiella arboris TaxID=2695275 RepID=A0A7K1YE04_9SPHI|nr:molybdate ABC transporter substrate-binding protein [Hufsiella arboris]MXV52640.1 molybdate ABC transporter substrate-binding protein [Hufsiella arboris]